jgi:ATP-dependent Zn protease
MELKNLINEAAILSVRNNYTVIQERFVFDSFEKSISLLSDKELTAKTNEFKEHLKMKNQSLLF